MERGELTERSATKRRSAVAYFAMAVVSALAGFAAWWLLSGAGETTSRESTRIITIDEWGPNVAPASAEAAERTKEPLDGAKGGAASEANPNDPARATLDAPRAFHVHLFDEADGRAVANAALYVSPVTPEVLPHTTTDWGEVPALHTLSVTGLQPVTEGALATAKSDDDGRAAVDVPPRRVLLVNVLASGYAPVHFEAALDRGTRERPLEVGLAKTASLRGTVRAPDGRPLGGLHVMARFDRREQLRPRRAFGTPFGRAHAQCETVTTPDGEFDLTRLPPDVEITLSAGADEDQMRSQFSFLWLDPGEERELDWTLPRGASVSGRVVGADGTPVARAVVFAVAADRGIMASSDCDESGRFRVNAPSGEILLQVDPRDAHRAATIARLLLADGEERSGVELRVADAAPLVVRALDPAGARVLPSETQVYPMAFLLIARDVVYEARPDEDSAWSIPGVEFGDVSVRVVAPLTSSWPAVETRFHHDGKHECEVRFTAGGKISGTLVDAVDRNERVEATTTLLDRGAAPQFWTARSMMSRIVPGTFEFGSVAAGTYDVLAQADDGRVGVAAGVVVGAGETRGDVVVALVRGATLELVAPPCATPPRTSTMEASSIRFEARQAGAFVGAAFAAPLGRVHLTVPPGRLTISAISAGEEFATREVEAKLGEVVRVRF